MSQYSSPAAVNPMIESPYIPSSESTNSGRSSSPDHPGERVADSSVHLTSLAMQYVNHANMNSTGYAYAEHGRLHGVTDVDVDEKPHLVYETMTEVQHQARQRMMNGGNMKSNVEAGNNNNFAGVPNESVKRSKWRGTTCNAVKVIWNIFLFIIAVGAFSIAVYNFLERNQNTVILTDNTMVTDPLSQTGSDSISLSQFEELNSTVAGLKLMLSQMTAKHESRYSELNATIFTAVEAVQSVSPSNELDLTFGCVDRTAECLIERQGNSPQFAFCETSPEDLEVEGLTNVNIYCNVDNNVQETNPILASLNIYGGQISCLCNVLDYSTTTLTPTCVLNIRRCPKTIRLNTTNMA